VRVTLVYIRFLEFIPLAELQSVCATVSETNNIPKQLQLVKIVPLKSASFCCNPSQQETHLKNSSAQKCFLFVATPPNRRPTSKIVPLKSVCFLPQPFPTGDPPQKEFRSKVLIFAATPPNRIPTSKIVPLKSASFVLQPLPTGDPPQK